MNLVGRAGGGGVLNQEIWFLSLAHTLRLTPHESLLLFLFCPRSGRWTVFMMRSAFVISTVELCCIVINRKQIRGGHFVLCPGNSHSHRGGFSCWDSLGGEKLHSQPLPVRPCLPRVKADFDSVNSLKVKSSSFGHPWVCTNLQSLQSTCCWTAHSLNNDALAGCRLTDFAF